MPGDLRTVQLISWAIFLPGYGTHHSSAGPAGIAPWPDSARTGQASVEEEAEF